MKSIKEQIDTEISRLEAEVQTLRLAEMRSNNSVQIDDSRLARIRDMLNTVHDQVQVGIKTLDYAKKYDFEAPAAPEAKTRSTTQLIQEADEFVGDTGSDKSAKK
jgi:ribosomal protein L30/L7E